MFGDLLDKHLKREYNACLPAFGWHLLESTERVDA